MFLSIEIPGMAFGLGTNKATQFFLSIMNADKDGHASKVLADLTRIVCGNTYGACDRSNSPLQWSKSHVGSWKTAEACAQVKAMLDDAKRGIVRRVEVDDAMEACEMDRASQMGLLALVLAATEQTATVKPIRQWISDAGVDFDSVITATHNKRERTTLAAVDLLAARVNQTLSGPDSSVYRKTAEYLVSQPGNWGLNALAVESAYTYRQTQLKAPQSGNVTSRVNAHMFDNARKLSATALDLCVSYTEQRQAQDSPLLASVAATLAL
jgi:hypothetical protein